MSDIEVLAQLSDEPLLVGRLHPHRAHGMAVRSTFVYDPVWTARPEGFDLDPATPRGSGAVQTPTGHVLPRALADCAPDRWGRTLRMQEERRLADEEGRAGRTLDDVDFLLGVRDDLRQGDLRLRDEGGFQRPGGDVPVLAELGDLLDLANRALHEDLGTAEIARLVRQGSSLGGARPKTHVQDAHGRLGIAKFPAASADSWDVMAWEKVCLDLAESAGIAVPSRQLLNIAGRRVLVVGRFDRVHRPGQAPARVGFRSAMTMCERSDGDAGSYLEIAAVIEEHSPQATEDLRQMWRRVAFNVLVTNTDDHLRNHAFLHERAGAWRLSPAFDINPDPQAGQSPRLHTAIDEYATEADLDVLMAVSPLFRFDEPSARQTLREVAQAVQGWRGAARHCGLDEAAVRQMTPAFEHARLRRALAC